MALLQTNPAITILLAATIRNGFTFTQFLAACGTKVPIRITKTCSYSEQIDQIFISSRYPFHCHLRVSKWARSMPPLARSRLSSFCTPEKCKETCLLFRKERLPAYIQSYVRFFLSVVRSTAAMKSFFVRIACRGAFDQGKG